MGAKRAVQLLSPVICYCCSSCSQSTARSWSQVQHKFFGSGGNSGFYTHHAPEDHANGYQQLYLAQISRQHWYHAIWLVPWQAPAVVTRQISWPPLKPESQQQDQELLHKRNRWAFGDDHAFKCWARRAVTCENGIQFCADNEGVIWYHLKHPLKAGVKNAADILQQHEVLKYSTAGYYKRLLEQFPAKFFQFLFTNFATWAINIGNFAKALVTRPLSCKALKVMKQVQVYSLHHFTLSVYFVPCPEAYHSEVRYLQLKVNIPTAIFISLESFSASSHIHMSTKELNTVNAAKDSKHAMQKFLDWWWIVDSHDILGTHQSSQKWMRHPAPVYCSGPAQRPMPESIPFVHFQSFVHQGFQQMGRWLDVHGNNCWAAFMMTLVTRSFAS